MEGDILQKWMDANGLKPATLATKIKVSRQVIYLRLKDETIPEDFKIKLALAGYSIPALSVKSLDNNQEYGLPVMPVSAMAGFGKGDFPVSLEDIELKISIPHFKGKADFYVAVTGSSMYPKYSSGDIVACKMLREPSFIQWNKCHLIDTTQGLMIKRLRKSQNKGFVLCRSDNPDYEDFEVPEKEIRNVALIVGAIRFE